MKKFLLTLLVIIVACAIPLIGFSQDKFENTRPLQKRQMMKQDCGERNFYDKYSKEYLNRRDCQEEMRTQNRVFIQEYTYQPFVFSNPIIINRNHGWRR